MKTLCYIFFSRNFHYVYLSKEVKDDYPLRKDEFDNENRWCIMRRFLQTLTMENMTAIYPPLTVINLIEDKYKQKNIISDYSLPYNKVSLPLTEVEEGKSWTAMNWHQFYNILAEKLNYELSKKEYDKSSLTGLVLKPRFGSCGDYVLILKKRRNK